MYHIIGLLMLIQQSATVFYLQAKEEIVLASVKLQIIASFKQQI